MPVAQYQRAQAAIYLIVIFWLNGTLPTVAGLIWAQSLDSPFGGFSTLNILRLAPRQTPLPLNTLKSEIAATAAALVVEEGLEYGPAKRRALKQLGLPARTALPDNDLMEDAVREYIAVFCADTQPAELAALRALALVWMERLAAFRPYLAGAVWNGTATRLSDIYIQLFCDDPKSAEIALIEHNVDYEPRTVTGFTGTSVEALSLSSVCKALNENIGVHLMVYDHDDLRGALRPDAKGRTPRGDLAAVQKLLSPPFGA